MSSSKTTSILIVGATGRTGSSIVSASLEAGHKVIASIRPTSFEKLSVKELAASGVEIRSSDIEADSQDQLKELLNGVDVLVIAVQLSTDQKPLLRAAKDVGTIKRVLPSEWTWDAPHGSIHLNDEKAKLRQFIKDLALPYTFVSIGWWSELSFPSKHADKDSPFSMGTNVFVNSGEQPFVMTSVHSVGRFVVKIIEDPRTLNQSVLVWDYERSTAENWDLATKIAGEDFSDYSRMHTEQVQMAIDNAPNPFLMMFFEFLRSIHVKGENTVAAAKSAGYLDARELYPDYQPGGLDKLVEGLYTKPWPPVAM